MENKKNSFYRFILVLVGLGLSFGSLWLHFDIQVNSFIKIFLCLVCLAYMFYLVKDGKILKKIIPIIYILFCVIGVVYCIGKFNSNIEIVNIVDSFVISGYVVLLIPTALEVSLVVTEITDLF